MTELKLEHMARILKPFKEQTDLLQTDNLTFSNIIPTLLELTLSLKEPSLNKSQAQKVMQDLRNRFSIFLDPNSTNFDPMPSAAVVQVHY